MVLKESIKPRGEVELILKDRKGKVVTRRKAKNLIVSSGKTLVANLFRGFEKKAISHMAVGTGNTPPSPTDTTLEHELLPRKAFETNSVIEESTAYITLANIDGKGVLRLTARKTGESGNNLRVKLTKGRGESFNITVQDKKKTEEFTEEEVMDEEFTETFENLDMDPESKRYCIQVINERSRYVTANALEQEMPVIAEEWQFLGGGADAVVTLASTFGYTECNGALKEAGIFNTAEAGTMYNRVVFPEITKTDKLTLTLIWKVTF